jgi:hypothetical protein
MPGKTKVRRVTCSRMSQPLRWSPETMRQLAKLVIILPAVAQSVMIAQTFSGGAAMSTTARTRPEMPSGSGVTSA